MAALDPEASYLAWTLRLVTDTDEAAVREVDFVEGDCELSITTEGAEMDKSAAAPPADDGFDVLALIAMAKAANAAEAPVTEAAPAPEPVAVTAPAARRPAGRRDLRRRRAPRRAEAPATGGGAAQTIRVDLDRLDRLIDPVGELVINQAMLTQRIAEAGLARARPR